jgi:hypothetical protein
MVYFPTTTVTAKESNVAINTADYMILVPAQLRYTRDLLMSRSSPFGPLTKEEADVAIDMQKNGFTEQAIVDYLRKWRGFVADPMAAGPVGGGTPEGRADLIAQRQSESRWAWWDSLKAFSGGFVDEITSDRTGNRIRNILIAAAVALPLGIGIVWGVKKFLLSKK